MGSRQWAGASGLHGKQAVDRSIRASWAAGSEQQQQGFMDSREWAAVTGLHYQWAAAAGLHGQQAFGSSSRASCAAGTGQ